MRVIPWMVGALLLSVGIVHAQQAELSDTQKIRQLQFERNACDMTMRDLREKLASELRQTLERAEKAETEGKGAMARAEKAEAALKLAQEELVKAHTKAAPAPVEKPKE